MRVSFVAGPTGPWRVTGVTAVRGASLPDAEALEVVEQPTAAPTPLPDDAVWALHGVTSNERYTTKQERELLARRPAPLGRADSTVAVLIPVTKSDAWWALAQDERRSVIERSRHVPLGLAALPAVARRLHHSRDLGEPFDFLTWFELAPRHLPLFDELLAALRSSPEWTWVEREVEVRLVRAQPDGGPGGRP